MAIDCTLADKCAYEGHLTESKQCLPPHSPPQMHSACQPFAQQRTAPNMNALHGSEATKRQRVRERVGNQKHDVQHKKIFALLSHICLHSLYLCTLCTICIGVCGSGLALQSLKPGRTDILYFIMRKRTKKQERENEKRQRRKVKR